MITLPSPPPAPDLTMGEMALGAAIMGLILFLILITIGEALIRMNACIGRAIVLTSLPLGVTFTITAFLIMVTG